MDARIDQFDQLLLDDVSLGPELFDRLRETQRELGLLHGDRPTCSFLRPHILHRRQYDEIKYAAETIAHAFEKVANAALADEKLMEVLCMTPREEEMARIDPGYARLCVTSRLDSYITEEGFCFLEYNAETPAGVGDQMQLEKLLFALSPMQTFLARHRHWLPQPHDALLKSLLTVYREWGGEVEKPNIAIVDWPDVPTSSEFRVLKDYFIARGHDAVITDPTDLTYDGNSLSADGFRVDILYKRVVIHEFLDRFDEEHPLVHAYKEGKVCMVNSFRSKLVHKKSSFAILTDPAYHHLFTESELELIRRHVPWTRLVRPAITTFREANWDLLSLISKHREEFVLKPNDDYGGRGVQLGWEMNAEEWKAAVQDALEKPYVVQERVKGLRTSIPAYSDRVFLDQMYVDLNPFLFENKVEGALIRLSAGPLLNVTSGGGQTALLVLED
ncbi:MAG TPA: circularly permuted type 2 ATP-grasp protein [Pyrinomonadaceae bacterium]|nr:circularly permuted type 2 ATP-grasp protein [Pyrinomonadaceae bacterium]